LLHALYEGSTFAYGCAYLLGAPFYSPALHAAKLLICRASPSQLNAVAERVAADRGRALARAGQRANQVRGMSRPF
jgi:hypothetical protein